MDATVSPEQLARLQPITALGGERLRELAPMCKTFRFPRGVDPLRAMDWTHQVAYLLRGQLKVVAGDGSVRVIVGGEGRANAPLVHGDSLPAATRAITDIELLSMGEDTLDIMVTWNQLSGPGASSDSGSDATDWRMMSGMFAVSNLTEGAFASLPPANIQTLLERFQRIQVKRGDIIIRQGDPGDYYYLIESGRCTVSRLVAGAPVQLAELKEGDAFGEEALVAEASRNATVTMKTNGTLLRLSKEDFDALLRAPLLQRVGFDEAAKRVSAGAVWIDVRYPAEYQADGYPGAINIPLNDIRQASASLEPEKEYIVYCQTGRRSSAAAFLLSQRGLHAALLDGGMRARAGAMESVE